MPFQMRAKGSTRPRRKDPRYVEAFNWARDMEYTVKEARWIASEVVALMDADPSLTVYDAIRRVFGED